jgi:propanol-preferring alcohol dehydrogenase
MRAACAAPICISSTATFRVGGCHACRAVAQVALAEGRRVFAFTRPGDAQAQPLALRLGVQWAGDSTQAPPQPMDGAILFALADANQALEDLRAGRVAGAAVLRCSP